MIGIASSKSGPDIPAGDLLLRQAFEQAGHTAQQVVWSDHRVDWRAFDFVVIRSCWDYHLRPAEFLWWLGGLAVPVVNVPSLIRWNLNKRYLLALEQRGITIAATVWLEVGEKCEIGARKVVVKPLISASAYQTQVMSEGVAQGPAMVQEFVEEVATDGEWSLMYFGAEFSHAVLKKPAAGDFRVQQEYGGTAVAMAPPEEALRFGAHVIAAAPSTPALARVDMVLTARGPLLMELELIEPELFLPADGVAAALAAQAILRSVY